MNILMDVRYAIQVLARSRVFTLTSVLSLSAGIAATTAIFSLADALLLRPRAGVNADIVGQTSRRPTSPRRSPTSSTWAGAS